MGPLTPDEGDRLFAPFAGLAALGLAVSGGADSSALFHLAADWAARAPGRPRLMVLTVDHRLRPGAAAECAAVVRMAAERRIAAEILVRPSEASSEPLLGDIQAAARRARYDLLVAAAHRHRLGAVLLGHHLDDQAETLLLRLARGSGLRGLSGMRAVRLVGGVAFHRPLLGVPAARLRATLIARGLRWTEDPSNADPRFARSRLRALMPDLAAAGLLPERLAETAARLARASSLVDAVADDLRAAAVTEHGGYLSVDRALLAAAHPEAALRVVADAVRDLRRADYGPRLAPLEDWYARFVAGTPPTRLTLGGVVLDAARRGRLWLYPEAGRSGFEVLDDPPDGPILWDGRLRLELARDAVAGDIQLAALGAEGRRELERLGHRLPGPARAAESVPALKRPDDGALLAVPAAGFCVPGVRLCAAPVSA